MKPLRVLMLITNLGKGGAQRVFHDHSLAFSSFASVEEAVFDLEEDHRVYDTGFPLHGLKRNDWMARLGPVGRLLSRAWALRQVVSNRGFDIVISHMDGANWVNVMSASGARKILVVHGTVLRDQNIRGLRQWLRVQLIFPWLYNRADCTVAVSEGIARELKDAGRVRNVQAIPNFFDVSVLEQQARMPLEPALSSVFRRPGVLVTSGRLAEQKKQVHLIEILAELLVRGVNTCLVILGDGELRDSLLRKCRDLRLKTYQAWDKELVCHDAYDVYFLGYVANPYQFLARSTLFLFPSGWEGFPLALCEAMISGVTVVSADCPTGPREILAPGTVRDTYDLRFAEFARNGVLMPMIEGHADLAVWVDTVAALLVDGEERSRLAANGAQAMQGLDRTVVLGHWQKLVESVAHVG